MKRRLLLAGAAMLGAGTLAGCAAPTLADYAKEQPRLDLRRFFNGRVDAHGIFTDRSGKVVKRFRVDMVGRWDGDTGVLDENFKWSDGTTSRRVWTLKRQADGTYRGTADDVVGEAQGQARGNAFNWTYTLALPVDGRVWHVDFDDWMYLMDDRVMLNTAVMSKWGVKLGEVTLSFVKRP